MALIFIDSFDHYEYGSQDDKWTQRRLVDAHSLAPQMGRNGTQGLYFPNGSAPEVMRCSKTFTFARQTLYAGFAMKVAEYGENARNGFFGVMNINTFKVSYALEQSGQISIWKGAEQIGTLLGYTTCPLHQGCWYYLEFRQTVSSNVNTGYVEVRINGRTEFTFAGDTLNGNSESANRIWLGQEDSILGAKHKLVFDDLYACDDAGSYNNTFLGDVRVDALLPNSDGTVQWAVSTTGNNYQMVDETLPNSDQDYTETSSPGRADTLHMANLSVNSAYVFGVYTLLNARKNNAGDRTIRPVITTNGSTYVGSTRAINMDYQYWEEVFELNPVQATSWSIADVNSLQIGYELVS